MLALRRVFSSVAVHSVAAFALLGASASAELPGGTASRAARQDAIRAMPLNSVTPQMAQRIHQIVNHPSIFRRLPVTTIESDPQFFLFLLRNPEVIVSIWQQLGITKVELQRSGPFSFNATDGMGTDWPPIVVA